MDTSKWNARMVGEYADSCTWDLSEEQKLQMANHILNRYEEKKQMTMEQDNEDYEEEFGILGADRI